MASRGGGIRTTKDHRSLWIIIAETRGAGGGGGGGGRRGFPVRGDATWGVRPIIKIDSDLFYKTRKAREIHLELHALSGDRGERRLL